MSRLAAILAAVALFVAASGGAFAVAPADFKLLALVPPGAQIVAGFSPSKDSRHPAHYSLLFNTQLNILDLEDWVSLAGLDPTRSYNEVIQASFAPPGAMPREHLLLVEGSFQSERIFNGARNNGAVALQLSTVTVLAIEPFPRESLEMRGMRWLAILENRIVVFGTPWIVRQAVLRFESRVGPDPLLLGRVTQLNSDVRCWSVMTAVPESPYNVFLDTHSPWNELFRGAEALTVGLHAGSRVRIDIFLRARSGVEFGNIDMKTSQLRHIFILEGGDTGKLAIGKLGNEGMRASISLSKDEFLAWKQQQFATNKELLDLAREKGRVAASSDPDGSVRALPPEE